MEHIKTPTGLKARGKRQWTEVTEKYELRLDELNILEDICREIDLIDSLEKELKGLPVMMKGSQGQDIVNPLIPELRQHRATKKMLWNSLKLPDDESEGGYQINAQRKGGHSRWSTAYGK